MEGLCKWYVPKKNTQTTKKNNVALIFPGSDLINMTGSFCSYYKPICACEAWPSFAGDDSHLLDLALGGDLPRLPPLIIGGVHHVQDVTKFKVQALTGQAGVLGFIIVKQGSREKNTTPRGVGEA